MTVKAHNKFLEERLLEWARWFREPQGYGLGYPSSSIECRILGRQGNTMLASQVENHRAEEVERWVMELARINILLAEAVRMRYFFPDDLSTSLARKATRFDGGKGIHARDFEKRVERALYFLEGRILSYWEKEMQLAVPEKKTESRANIIYFKPKLTAGRWGV